MTILNTINDSDKLSSTVVIIDVFRSSNTIIELLYQGAGEIIAVEDENVARNLKKKHPEMLLFGERNGIRLTGFDGDNSPTGFAAKDIIGKKILLTTSGGTRCIEAARGCSAIYIASFANALCMTSYFTQNNIREVSFWAVGLKAMETATEDLLCAEYLSKLFHNEKVDFNSYQERLVKCEGAQRRRERNQFDDLEFCLKQDTREIVPKCLLSSSGLMSIKAC